MAGSVGLLVERFDTEAWNQRSESAAYAILHPELRFRGSLGPEHHGPDGFVRYMRAVHAALAGYTCTILDRVVEGPRAAVRLEFEGRHQGAFFDVPATGRQIKWSGSAFFTMRDARIAEIWVLGDIDAVKAQLGAVPGAEF